MNVKTTHLQGLLLLSPKTFCDERGSFYESWCLSDYKKWGIQENFLQDNVSTSHQNVLRGMHAQKNQGQLVTVVYGQIFDVVVDIYPNSPTYKQYFSVLLDAKEGIQLYMPPGFAHGFVVLSELAVVHYKCSQYYDPRQEQGIIWNDPEIGIKWPISNPIVSEKDRTFKGISDYAECE